MLLRTRERAGDRAVPAQLMLRVSGKRPHGCCKKTVISDFPLMFRITSNWEVSSPLRVELMGKHLPVGTSIFIGNFWYRLGTLRRWAARFPHVSVCGQWQWERLMGLVVFPHPEVLEGIQWKPALARCCIPSGDEKGAFPPPFSSPSSSPHILLLPPLLFPLSFSSFLLSFLCNKALLFI